MTFNEIEMVRKPLRRFEQNGIILHIFKMISLGDSLRIEYREHLEGISNKVGIIVELKDKYGLG